MGSEMCIRDRYKLIYFYHARRWEFYDLAKDIGETKNLLNEQMDPLSLSAVGAAQLKFSRKVQEFAAQLPELRASANYFRPQFDLGSDLMPLASEESRGQLAGWGAGRTWLDQHSDINMIARGGKLDLVFIGDSITQGWGGQDRSVGQVAPEVWKKFYSKRKAANFGISGDGFRNLLWRIENGNLDGINPKIVVLNIGTNDLSRGDDAALIASGIEQVVQRIEERRQRAKILLLGIFPRGESAGHPMRLKAKKVNKLLQKISDDRKTFFLDIGKHFVDENESVLRSHYRDDFLHLSPQGYEAWAHAIEPAISKYLEE